jgi:hypothetical protein
MCVLVITTKRAHEISLKREYGRSVHPQGCGLLRAAGASSAWNDWRNGTGKHRPTNSYSQMMTLAAMKVCFLAELCRIHAAWSMELGNVLLFTPLTSP